TRDVLLLDAVRLCAGVPARSTVRRDGDKVWVEDGLNDAPVLSGAPARCSESDGRMIYGVNETITGMVLRRLENQGSIYRSPRGTIEAEKICMVEPDLGKWVVKSAFGIVKHGGVTPINPVRGITSLNEAWDPEATWRFNHSIFGRVSYDLRLRPIILWSRGREDSVFAAFLLFLGRQNA
ncbi:unnamed protein product, partial [Prunus brigantina]